MTAQLDELAENLERVAQSVAAARWIANTAPRSEVPSDLLRSALVSAVSALDAYAHGIVDRAAVAVATQPLPQTGLEPAEGRGALAIPLALMPDLYGIAASADPVTQRAPTAIDAIGLAVAEATRRLTYQSPDEIAAALASVGIRRIWSNAYGVDPKALEDLRAACYRRNKIVHEADLDRSVHPATLRPICASDVEGVANLVRRVSSGIDRYVTAAFPTVFTNT